MGGSDRTAAMDFFNNSDEGKMARNLGLSVEDLQETFDEFDTDGSGGIDSKEFGCLLAHLGITWKSARIEKTVKDIDQDENGLIDFKEFVGWFLKLEDDDYNSDDDNGYNNHDGYNNHAKNGNYEHDWDISEEEN